MTGTTRLCPMLFSLSQEDTTVRVRLEYTHKQGDIGWRDAEARSVQNCNKFLRTQALLPHTQDWDMEHAMTNLIVQCVLRLGLSSWLPFSDIERLRGYASDTI